MARKTDEERLKELNEKITRMQSQKQQIASRVEQQKRKARTKRLIEVGAIFEKNFEIEGKEQAEKIALALKQYVLKNKDKVLKMSMEEIENKNKKVGEQKNEQAPAK